MISNSIKQYSNVEKFSEVAGNTGVYCGVDAHKNSYTVCIYAPEKWAMVTYSTTNTNMNFVDEINSYSFNIKQLVYEAGPTGFPLAWACQNACSVDEISGEVISTPIPVKVIAALFVPQAAVKANKSDSRDAKELAILATKPLDLESCSIYIPTRSEQDLKELSRLRELAVDEKRKATQRLKSYLLRSGIDFPSKNGEYTKSVGEKLKALDLPPTQHKILCDYVDKVDACAKDKKAKEEMLDDALNNSNNANDKEKLETIPGIGSIVANTFLSEVPNAKERFANKDQLAQYCGATPIIRESGEKTGKVRGYLTPMCNTHIQPLLVQAAWVFVRNDEEANKIYKRKIASGKSAGTAIMSIVKKLLAIMLSILKHGTTYKKPV